MKDEVLHCFVEKLLKENIVTSEFEQHIDMFSRFLSYTNSDYKYNGTYLSQYVEDYINTSQWLKRKNEKYVEILMEIMTLGCDFVLLLDQIYYAHSLSKEKDGVKSIENEIHYIKINKEKIISPQIEVKITIIQNETEYTISKVYADFEDKELAKSIATIIKNHILL